MLPIIRDLEAVREKLNLTKMDFCKRLSVHEPTYYKWLDGTWGEKMHPSTKDHLGRILVELQKEARSDEDKFQDFLEENFDHYHAGGGSLCRTISLFKLMSLLKTDEDSIIELIQKLLTDGKLRLVMLPRLKDTNINDVVFDFQIGTGTRTGYLEAPVANDCNLHSGAVTDVRLYRSEPMTEAEKAEQDPREITDVQGAVVTLREEIRASLDQRIIKVADGSKTALRLRREDIEDEREQKNANLRAGAKKE